METKKKLFINTNERESLHLSAFSDKAVNDRPASPHFSPFSLLSIQVRAAHPTEAEYVLLIGCDRCANNPQANKLARETF